MKLRPRRGALALRAGTRTQRAKRQTTSGSANHRREDERSREHERVCRALNRQKHYAIAHGSANEVKGALATAYAWGWIDNIDQQSVILDRLLALLWRLTHPRG